MSQPTPSCPIPPSTPVTPQDAAAHKPGMSDCGAADLPRIMDLLPVMVFWKDRDRRFRAFNRAFHNMLGFDDPSIILGQTDTELFGDTPQVDFYRRCDQSVIDTGQALLNFEEEIHLPGCATIHLMTSKMPLHDATGAVEGVLCVAVDITKQKQTQDELSRTQKAAEAARDREHHQSNLLRNVLEAIPYHVFWKDADLSYRGCNQAFAARGGHASTASVIGQTDFDMPWSNEEAEFYRRCDREVMERGVPILNIEESQKRSGGEDTTLLTSKVPLRDEKGQVVGILGMYTDITDQKRDERERNDLQQQLLETSRQAGKAEVATDVLHNVGNALNSINVSASLLAERLQNPTLPMLQRVADTLAPHADDFAHYVANDRRSAALPGLLGQLANTLSQDRQEMAREVSQLQEQLEHIKQIVASQQSFARDNAVTEPVEAATLLDDALRIASSGRSRVGIEMSVDVASETPPAVIDRHLALQILVNLINNACQAAAPVGSQADPGKVSITAHHDPNAGTVHYTVKDNGKGISSENLEKVFDHGFTTRATGHGFGLHSAHTAAGAMGGTLVARSDGPGTGATFVLEVPLRPVKDHDVAA